MNKSENLYCRFCAELKSSDKLLYLDNDEKKYEETLVKLTFLNANYVNVSDPDNTLPKTVCFMCYDSLNEAYVFLNKVKNAQAVLSDLVLNDTKYEQCDDTTPFEGFLDIENIAEIKNEVPCKLACINSQSGADFYEVTTSIEVKKEPKDEVDDSASFTDDSVDCLSHVQSLNVHDILDAAMCPIPLTSNVTIYAKDLSNINKQDITSWKDYPWVCAYCNIVFLDIGMLRSHIKLVHDKCHGFTCIDCKKFGSYRSNFDSFIKHVGQHRHVLRKYCHYCNSLFEDARDLGAHISRHFNKSKQACPMCGEIFKDEDGLQTHLTEFKSIKPKRKPRRKHGTPITIEDLTCNVCNKVYKNPNSLRDHQKLHTTDRKRNFTCDRCGKAFYMKGALKSHIMLHDKARPHVCKICNKSFLFHNMLRRHVQVHTAVKPFSCEQCGKCFRLPYQLNTHKIIHTDSMPYVCQYCNKAFRFKQILKNHERQHTGAKPYCCQQCVMEFTNWSNYNKHMKRRHGTDTSKKKITPEGVFPFNSETGQIQQYEGGADTEEWKTKVMIPLKRGKKKAMK